MRNGIEKNIVLSMKENEWDVLVKKCISRGIGVSELINCFVADLVCGEESGGSDERMYAEAWLDRRGFEYLNEDTLLCWLGQLLDCKDFEWYLTLPQYIVELAEELEEEEEECYRESLLMEIQQHRADYEYYKNMFEKKFPNTSWEVEVAKCREWLEENRKYWDR